MVAEAIFGDEVIFGGLAVHDTFHNGVNFGDCLIGEKNRLYVGIQEAGKEHAVFLFVRAREFMFLMNPFS